MNEIWLLEAQFETDMRFATYDGENSAIDVTHFVDLSDGEDPDVAIGIFGGHMGEQVTESATLVLRLEDFDVDYFTWGGPMFVSERMRDAMALDPSEVRYIDVDDSQSAPLPRAKKYKIMEPLIYKDLMDPQKSVYNKSSIPPPGEFGPHEVYKLVARADVAPTRDLFYDKFFATFVFCSDRLAQRVLSAGCTGMDFTDPRGYGLVDVKRRRTLHGVEVYGQKADPEDDRPRPPITDVYDESVNPDLLRAIIGDKDKIDLIISQLKSDIE
jgi:hypothetical protein